MVVSHIMLRSAPALICFHFLTHALNSIYALHLISSVHMVFPYMCAITTHVTVRVVAITVVLPNSSIRKRLW